MSWSYRICKTVSTDGSIKYSIKEVYDKPAGCTIEDIGAVVYLDKDNPEEDTEVKCVESIRRQLVMMLLDTTRPIYENK